MTREKLEGLFVTGTDTGVGKTYIAAMIARALCAAGCKVGVYKPAASGCRLEAGELLSDDAVALWDGAGRPGELNQVCPQRFAAPLAPHLAARAEGREVSAELLRTGLDYWRARSDFLIVEGVGGLLSPVGDEDYVADLVADFGFPLIIVGDNSIGAINRLLSALVVAATFRDGLAIAGVILNETRDSANDPSVVSNLSELRARAVPPVLGLVQFGGELPPGIDWRALGREI